MCVCVCVCVCVCACVCVCVRVRVYALANGFVHLGLRQVKVLDVAHRRLNEPHNLLVDGRHHRREGQRAGKRLLLKNCVSVREFSGQRHPVGLVLSNQLRVSVVVIAPGSRLGKCVREQVM
jgi:hypothetical protein